MASQVSQISSSSPLAVIPSNKDEIRPKADFQPSIWGDLFLNCPDQETDAETKHRHEELKEVVRNMIVEPMANSSQKLTFIDAVQRLGVSYHFTKEIEDELEKIYSDNTVENNLYTTSLRFRLLREHGFNVSCDVFNKFKDEQGKFEPSMTNDIRGLLELYEASYLRVHGEDVLDEAISFATNHLSLAMAALDYPLSEQVSHALKQSIRRGLPRVEARHYLSIYKDIESHNKALLEFAKIDFNMLQLLHRKELSEICRWWKDLDFQRQLPYARDRVVEGYFWIMGVYFEPQYSLGRKMLTKVIAMASIVDDTYDSYATYDELVPYTDAIERWDIKCIDQLPEYMKVSYKALLDVYEEMEQLMAEHGRQYRVEYARNSMIRLAQAYLVEARWTLQNYKPSFEEFKANALPTCGYAMLAITAFVGMGDIVTPETFKWAANDPKIIQASTIICRFMDDVAEHKHKHRREDDCSAIECYMEEYGVTAQEAYDVFNKHVEISWKDTPIGQMGSVSNDLGLQFSSALTQQGGNTESQAYTQLPQQQQGGNIESQTYTQLPQEQQGGNIGSQTYTHLPQQQQGVNIDSQTYIRLLQQQQGGNIESQTYSQLPQQQQGGNIGSQSYTQLPQEQQGGNIGSQTYTHLPQQQQGGNIDSHTYTRLLQLQQGGNIGSQTYSQLPQQQQGGNIDSQTYTQLPQQQQGGNIASQTYTQLPQQHLMSNKPVGVISPTMLDIPRQHQLPTLNKRKAPIEPIYPNSMPQKLSLPNKRVAQMEHRPSLQPMFAPSKRPAQMHTGSNSPGSQPSPTSNKKAVPNKSGSSASRNQPAQMRQSPKVKTESFESVRSKMRENLAGALALVSQKQGENATVEKKSNGEAAVSPGKREEGSHPAYLGSGNSDAVFSIPAEPQGTFLSNLGGSVDGNNNDATQILQHDGQQLKSCNLLPDENVPSGDNIFASDELLQGNGLSWVLEPEIDVAMKKEFEIDGKQIPDDEKMGKDDLEQSLPSAQELAYQIEAELFKLFGGVNKKYKEKGRSLLFNLKDRNNPELRERVVSGEISPERLCSMSAEELASKELSQWRQAKAEELAQMVVLPDVQVDIRRLVRKTHKGEVQVEFEQTDSSAVEVSAGTSVTQRPKTDAKQASKNDKTVGRKDKSDAAGKNNKPEDPNLTITIPSSEGPDPMQGLMGEDELKDADFLPPIVSLDEFMQSLDSEPPFENLPGDAGKATSISDKDVSEGVSGTKSSGRDSQDPPDTVPNKPGNINSSNLKSHSDVKPNNTPTKSETVVSATTLKGERVWEGMLQLNISSMTSVICIFKSGEKTSTKDWPGLLEIKGRVRLDAFEKFLQELPMSRSRAVMVVHVVCKEGSTESEHGSLLEAADSYILDGRVGFAEASSGVEIYFCPPYAKTLERLTKIIPKDQLQALNAIDNGLIGVVVWRRAPLISPNSTSHHKYTSQKQHFTSTITSRRPHEKDDAIANMNANFPSKPTYVSHSVPPPDDDDEDDDVPPGFGPAASRDEDDLPEFNFSGGSNPSGLKYPPGYQSQRVGMTSSHLHSQTSSRPVDQMRELIQKYGQPDSNNAPVGVPMRRWNDDDDDIPEWQPQTSQQQHLLPPPSKVRRFQQSMHAPHQLPHQTLPAMHVQGQHGNWRVPPPGSPSPGQSYVNRPQFYGTVGTGQPASRKDAPHSRGF